MKAIRDDLGVTAFAVVDEETHIKLEERMRSEGVTVFTASGDAPPDSKIAFKQDGKDVVLSFTAYLLGNNPHRASKGATDVRFIPGKALQTITTPRKTFNVVEPSKPTLRAELERRAREDAVGFLYE